MVLKSDPLADGQDDSTSWWEALGLPAPEMCESQHSSRTVVLLGHPRVGKRTLCQHLSRIASTQYNPESLDGARHHLSHLGESEPKAGGKLYRIGDAANEAPEDGASEDFATGMKGTGESSTGAVGLSSGTGIAHDFVLQRLAGLSAYRRSALPINKKAIEFFCCDCAGALSIALPTLQSLQSAVVLMVIDVSTPNTIKEQLDWCFQAVEKHTTNVLRESLPDDDAVLLLKMMEDTQDFWIQEEDKLQSLKQLLQNQSSSTSAPDSSVKEHVRLTPGGNASLCPLRTMIVCTKGDLLEKLSTAYSTSQDEIMFDGLIDISLRRSVDTSRLSVLQLVSQLIRHYAMTRRCALASISSRVVHSGEDNNAVLVHPFLKGMWGYIEYLLNSFQTIDLLPKTARNSMPQTQASISETIAPLCNPNFFPSSLIPCGLDRISMLNSFVATEAITLPLCSKQDEDSKSFAMLSSTFPLHQDILQSKMKDIQTQKQKGPNEGDDVMVWDSI